MSKEVLAKDDFISLSLTEHGVAELWKEVLSMAESPATHDNFFALGGDSMAMVMIEYRIKEEFSVELPPGALLRSPTLRELSALVDSEMIKMGENNGRSSR